MAGRLGLYLSNAGIILVERTLEDYFDLNCRYLKISDTLLFADEQVKFDVIPKYYFSLLPDEFYNLAFVKSDKLTQLQTLEEISPFLKLDDEKLLKVINKDNKTAFSQIGDIKQFVADERTKRFNKLIDEKFSDNQLIYILQLISKRADKEIQELKGRFLWNNRQCKRMFDGNDKDMQPFEMHKWYDYDENGEYRDWSISD